MAQHRDRRPRGSWKQIFSIILATVMLVGILPESTLNVSALEINSTDEVIETVEADEFEEGTQNTSDINQYESFESEPNTQDHNGDFDFPNGAESSSYENLSLEEETTSTWINPGKESDEPDTTAEKDSGDENRYTDWDNAFTLDDRDEKVDDEDSENNAIEAEFSDNENHETIEGHQDDVIFAENTGEEIVSEDAMGAKVAYGDCGENASWELDSNGTLTISGSGEMADYESGQYSPWYSYRSKIKSIIVCDNIRKVGKSCFRDIRDLESVTLPDGLISIGENAFFLCVKLSHIELPNSIETIEAGAFGDCVGLNEIVLPNSLKIIPFYLFLDCINLKQVGIPEGVESIDVGAFEGCSSLTSLYIPGTVSSIGTGSFARCKNLTELSIPSSLKSIGENVFTECSSLSDIYYSGNEAEWSGIAGIENALIPDGTEIHYNSHYLEKVSRLDPTCTENGIEEHYKCAYCGKLFEDSNGQIELSDGDISIPPNGHVEVIDDPIQPTCTKTGLTQGSHCSICGIVLIAQREMPATGHAWYDDYTVDSEPTCIDNGSKSIHCSQCDAVKNEQIIPAIGHVWTENYIVDKQPNCIDEGSQSIHCTQCDAVKDEKVIPATGHSFGEWNVIKEATAREKGLKERSCSKCDFVEQEVIPRTIITPTIILSQKEFIYNGKEQKPTVIVKDDNEEISSDNYSLTFESSVNVGTYSVKVELKGEYEGGGSATYTIIPKEITPAITLSSTSMVYNGKPQIPNVTVMDGDNLINALNYDVHYEADNKDVGTYTVTVNLKGNYLGVGRASYRITPKTITPTVILSKASAIYDGKVKKPNVTVKNGSTNLSTSDYSITYPSELKNAGNYKIIVTLKGNYSGERTVSFKITAKEITPSVILSKTSYIYNGKIQKPAVTVNNGSINLAKSNYTVTYSSGLKNAGAYKVTVKLKGNYSGSKTVSYTIKPKKITPKVVLSKSSFVYNGKVQKPAITVINGSAKLATSDYHITYSSGLKNAGTYKIIVKMKGNYSGSKTVSYKITAKKITPTVSLSKTVFSYNGKVQKPIVTVKNGSKKLTTSNYSVSFSKGLKNVGSYRVIVRLKGNLSGSKTVSYKINPKGTAISNAIGTHKEITVKWRKQATQITGYQIQYSRSSSFTSGNKILTLANPSMTSTGIRKSEAGKHYYVRIRTYKKLGSVMYYSAWSEGAYTAIRQTIKPKKSFWMSTSDYSYEEFPKRVSYTFTTNQRMMLVVPFSINKPDGSEKFRITLKDNIGKIHQNYTISTKGYDSDDSYWCWNATSFVNPGTYTYTLEIIESSGYVTYSILGFLANSTSANIKSQITTESGNWIKIGDIGEGCPFYTLSTSNRNIVNSFEVNIDGEVYAWADKRGKATVTLKLANGKQYTSSINVVAGDPDFDARITQYVTRDNYFEVKVENYRPSDITIIRKGAKVVDDDYKEYDRNIKSGDNIVVKGGQTKTIRFYINGDYTWPDYKDFTLYAKFIFEGVTYDWHVWYYDSVYKKGGKWLTTYWD